MDAMDKETGEVLSLAEAADRIPPPRYWRRIDSIIEGDTGPEYEEAFWEVQKIVGPILKAAAENPYFKSKYTDLPSLLAQTMPHISAANLTQKQGAGRLTCYGGWDNPKRVLALPIWTQVRHKTSGQWERIYTEMPLLKIDPQGFGSAYTLGRRYSLLAFWCVAGTDDDGILASMQPNLDKDPLQSVAEGIIAQIGECGSVEELKAWQARNKHGFEILEEKTIAQLRTAYAARLKKLKQPAQETNTTKKVIKTKT